MPISTNSLMTKLIKGKRIDLILKKHESDFYDIKISDYLKKLCREHNIQPDQLVAKSQIDRGYGYQIFNGIRIPSRDKLLQLAIGLGLSLDDTQRLLKIGNHSILYPKFKRDVVLIYAISHHLDVKGTQELLSAKNLPVLGAKYKSRPVTDKSKATSCKHP